MTTTPDEQRIQASAAALVKDLGAGFSGAELVEAIREMSLAPNSVKLPDSAQAIWDEGLQGVLNPRGISSARSIMRWVRFIESTFDAAQVAKILGKSESTIRHYSSAPRLCSFLQENNLRFPDWQFTEGHVVPGVAEVLSSLPGGVHSQAVTGFFTQPNPDLMLHGKPASPTQWLIEGNNPQAVAEQLAGLGEII